MPCQEVLKALSHWPCRRLSDMNGTCTGAQVDEQVRCSSMHYPEVLPVLGRLPCGGAQESKIAIVKGVTSLNAARVLIDGDVMCCGRNLAGLEAPAALPALRDWWE